MCVCFGVTYLDPHRHPYPNRSPDRFPNWNPYLNPDATNPDPYFAPNIISNPSLYPTNHICDQNLGMDWRG